MRAISLQTVIVLLVADGPRRDWYAFLTRAVRNLHLNRSSSGDETKDESRTLVAQRGSPVVVFSPARWRAHDEKPNGNDPVNKRPEEGKQHEVAQGVPPPFGFGKVDPTRFVVLQLHPWSREENALVDVLVKMLVHSPVKYHGEQR